MIFDSTVGDGRLTLVIMNWDFGCTLLHCHASIVFPIGGPDPSGQDGLVTSRTRLGVQVFLSLDR